MIIKHNRNATSPHTAHSTHIEIIHSHTTRLKHVFPNRRIFCDDVLFALLSVTIEETVSQSLQVKKEQTALIMAEMFIDT